MLSFEFVESDTCGACLRTSMDVTKSIETYLLITNFNDIA